MTEPLPRRTKTFITGTLLEPVMGRIVMRLAGAARASASLEAARSAGGRLGSLAANWLRRADRFLERGVTRRDGLSPVEPLHEVVRSLDDLVFTLDIQQRYDGVYGRWAAITGLEPQQVLGRTPAELFGDQNGGVHNAAFRHALAGTRVVIECHIETPTGGRNLSIRLMPRVGPTGEITGVLGMGHEIARPLAELAPSVVADRMASVGALASGIAHDMNNPLASVIVNLELAQVDAPKLRDQPVPAEVVDGLVAGLRNARDSAERVRQLLRDLKGFSQVDEDERGPVDVCSVMDAALRLAHYEIRHRARLVRQYEKVRPIAATEPGLGHAILNLVVHAARAIEEGHVDQNEIRLAVREDGDHVCVEITSSTHEPAAADSEKVIGPILPIDIDDGRAGLSLAVAHRLVSAYGGTMTEVDRGGGTGGVRLVFPAWGRRELPALAANPVAVAALRGRVLVIMDEPMSAKAARRVLERDHDVVLAADGEAALEQVRRGERFDVILCDFSMARMTGAALLRELEGVAPCQAAAVIFLTGGTLTREDQAFLSQLPTQHIEKPFDAATLRARVRERISQSRPADATPGVDRHPHSGGTPPRS